MIFISVLVSVCNFQDNCPYNCFIVAYAKNLAKNPKKPLAKIFDKNPTKTLQKFGGTKTFIYF